MARQPAGVLVQWGKRLPGYYARFYEYQLGGGRKNRSKHFLTQTNAKRWVRQYNARIDLGHLGKIVPVSLREAVEQFAPGLAPLAPDTRTHYRNDLGLFQAVAGDKPLSEIGGGAGRALASTAGRAGPAGPGSGRGGVRGIHEMPARRCRIPLQPG